MKNRIKELRARENLTQLDLARLVDVRRETIVFLEKGLKQVEGTNLEIVKTDNEAVTKVVYSAEMFKKVREMYIKESN